MPETPHGSGPVALWLAPAMVGDRPVDGFDDPISKGWPCWAAAKRAAGFIIALSIFLYPRNVVFCSSSDIPCLALSAGCFNSAAGDDNYAALELPGNSAGALWIFPVPCSAPARTSSADSGCGN